VKTHFVLAAACFAIYFVINFIFFWTYYHVFDRTHLLKDKVQKYKDKKITKKELEKFRVPIDKDFGSYKKEHKFVYYLISSLTFFVTFKYNKMYYSHFYSFGMFKARWSESKDYRKIMTWFCITHMFLVDLFLIVIGIAGILSIDFMSNQLYITFIETVALSVIDIILGSIELYKLKEHLAYTVQKKKLKGRAGVGDGIEDDEEMLDRESREAMIKGLVAKVQGNKDLFLNNKLDELLDQFGDRRCKSMIELGTGWDKEEDPRRIITIPMSPTLLEERYDGDYHFTLNDMIGG